MTNNLRVGLGYDIHRLVQNRPLILGGVKIPHAKGLLGHSDADVLVHAIIDALLGAMALGDIGRQFPDKDPKYKDIDSMILLKKTKELIQKSEIINIDCNIICQTPKLAPFIDDMRKNIARVLELEINQISIKAKTNEGLEAAGEESAIKANAVVLISLQKSDCASSPNNC